MRSILVLVLLGFGLLAPSVRAQDALPEGSWKGSGWNGMAYHRFHVLHGESFVFKSTACVYCPATRSYDFEFRFEEEPDFYARDDAGRIVNGLEIRIWHSAAPFKMIYRFQRFIVTDRVRDTGFIYVLRAWNQAVGFVPFEVRNKTLRFSVPDDLMDDPDGLIGFASATYRHGLMNRQYREHEREYPAAYAISYSTIAPYCHGTSDQRPAPAPEAVPTTWGAVKALYGDD